MVEAKKQKLYGAGEVLDRYRALVDKFQTSIHPFLDESMRLLANIEKARHTPQVTNKKCLEAIGEFNKFALIMEQVIKKSTKPAKGRN